MSKVERVLHLYWRTKRNRVRKKNLTRLGKWMDTMERSTNG